MRRAFPVIHTAEATASHPFPGPEQAHGVSGHQHRGAGVGSGMQATGQAWPLK